MNDMDKKLTPQELAEQELADKIVPLIKELHELQLRRGNGVTLEKNQYIGDKIREIEAEIGQLRKEKQNLKHG